MSRTFVPSMFTALNMLCGYVALVLAGSGHVTAAAWFILTAALFDVLDGFVARLTDGASKFGGEFDSLADLVSFGAAPAYLAYAFGLSQMGAAGVFISAVPLLAAGVRLARFNIGDGGGEGGQFYGLPSTAQALALASFILWMNAEQLLTPAQLALVLSWMLVFFALLMLSRIQYDSFPSLSMESIRARPLQAVLYGAVFFCVLIFQAKAFFLAMLLYILLGVMRSLSLLVRQTVL
ncbi:MAG: CDP-diacylglycerol--serine O-phosphatidyltransferase [Prosthecochloris sp.]|uniref:CDP-diacylglycerol--serine O-phosphatidyltransferase n=1 Tax=Prosthecochloris TaxID=1101 RepID=UPI001F44033F|nr:CDP-diacylglycerol--serine O-phosphatidyltransferase [Prosthecochloris sp. ZM_2]MEC9486736.1 CDP-diacylglycerol--serine O-phosphatidyltransferase [Prosthecochloris sp.]